MPSRWRWYPPRSSALSPPRACGRSWFRCARAFRVCGPRGWTYQIRVCGAGAWMDVIGNSYCVCGPAWIGCPRFHALCCDVLFAFDSDAASAACCVLGTRHTCNVCVCVSVRLCRRAGRWRCRRWPRSRGRAPCARAFTWKRTACGRARRRRSQRRGSSYATRVRGRAPRAWWWRWRRKQRSGWRVGGEGMVGWRAGGGVVGCS